MITEKTKQNHKYNEAKLLILGAINLERERGIDAEGLAKKTGLTLHTVEASLSHYFTFYRKYFTRTQRKGSKRFYYFLNDYGLDILTRLITKKQAGESLHLTKEN